MSNNHKDTTNAPSKQTDSKLFITISEKIKQPLTPSGTGHFDFIFNELAKKYYFF